MSKTDALSRPGGGIIRKAGRWLTAMGIVFVVLGILAIINRQLRVSRSRFSWAGF